MNSIVFMACSEHSEIFVLRQISEGGSEMETMIQTVMGISQRLQMWKLLLMRQITVCLAEAV